MIFITEYILGQLGSFLGAIVGFIIYAAILFPIIMTYIKIRASFLPQWEGNDTVKFIEVMIGGILFWVIIPWAFWHFVLKAIDK